MRVLNLGPPVVDSIRRNGSSRDSTRVRGSRLSYGGRAGRHGTCPRLGAELSARAGSACPLWPFDSNGTGEQPTIDSDPCVTRQLMVFIAGHRYLQLGCPPTPVRRLAQPHHFRRLRNTNPTRTINTTATTIRTPVQLPVAITSPVATGTPNRRVPITPTFWHQPAPEQ